MSKRSLFWNDASGKLGNTVMYRAGGEQRTRQYVANIKNPKTLAQMTQRISMLNFVTMFKQLKYVINFGFPNKAANQSGWNAFVQANKSLPKVAITRAEADNLDYAPLGVLVSKGDIPLDTTMAIGDFTSFSDPEASIRGGFALEFSRYHAVNPSDLGLNSSDIGDHRTMLSNGNLVYKYLTANGNPFNLPTKFKITLLSGFYQSRALPVTNAWRLRADQIECYSGSTDVMKTIISNGDDEVFSMGLARGSYDTTGDEPVFKNLSTLCFTNLLSLADAPIVAVIISWTENGKTRVTTSMLQCVPADAEYMSQYRQDGDVYDQVLEILGVKSEDILATPPISMADANFGAIAEVFNRV